MRSGCEWHFTVYSSFYSEFHSLVTNFPFDSKSCREFVAIANLQKLFEVVDLSFADRRCMEPTPYFT